MPPTMTGCTAVCGCSTRSPGVIARRRRTRVWADFGRRGFKPVPLEPHEADDLFRPVERRKVHRGQVSFHTNHYFDERLEPYHGMEVLVGYDIFDASKVWGAQAGA